MGSPQNMQVKIKVWKRLREQIKRRFGFAKRTHVDHSPIIPSTFPFVVDIVRDFPPQLVTHPASPRSGCSSDGLRDGTAPERHAHQETDIGSSTDSVADSDPQSEGSSITTFGDMSTKYDSITSGEVLLESRRPDSDKHEWEEADSSSMIYGTAEGLTANSSHTPHSSTHSLSVEDNHAVVTSDSQSREEVPRSSSPLPENVKPGIPESGEFLLEDPEDPLSDDEDPQLPPPSSGIQTLLTSESAAQAEEVPLTHPLASHPIPLPSPNVNKAIPPPPPSESDDEALEVFLPGLILPTMFLPIPNTDPLTTLLNKYIFPPQRRPVRDLTGDWQRTDFHTLVMTNSWRALAKMARDRITSTNPEDLPLILSLWYLRLACLSRLRLFNQTSAECTNLFSVLSSIEPPSTRTYVFDRLVPFELEVMHARLKYWAGDHMSYLDALSALLRKCRTKARLAKSDNSIVAMWKERGSRICLIIASQLMEMKDFTGAAKLLEPLCVQKSGVTSPALRSSIARIYLQGGHIEKASKHFAAVSADPTADKSTKDMNAALLASAEGRWMQAAETLASIIAEDPDNYVAINNMSVALLSQGKLKEAITALESALKASPSSLVVAEPFLFNLSTMYELHSATAADKKKELLIEVGKWSGDGLKTTCLKMPSN